MGIEAPQATYCHGYTRYAAFDIPPAGGACLASNEAAPVRSSTWLSPSMHKYGDVFVPSGLSTERAQPATYAERESWQQLRVEVLAAERRVHGTFIWSE